MSSRSYAYDLQERGWERLFVTCPRMSCDAARMTRRFPEAQRLTVHRYSPAQVRVGLLPLGSRATITMGLHHRRQMMEKGGYLCKTAWMKGGSRQLGVIISIRTQPSISSLRHHRRRLQLNLHILFSDTTQLNSRRRNHAHPQDGLLAYIWGDFFLQNPAVPENETDQKPRHRYTVRRHSDSPRMPKH